MSAPEVDATGTEPPGDEEVPTADVLVEVDRLIRRLESHPDPAVGEGVAELLANIDAVHRVALTHLVNGIHGIAGEAFMNRLTADPAVRLLLMSYDLVAMDRRVLAEEALDPVRGHLHGHGIDVELDEVVGGTVYVRLHGLEASGVGPAAVRKDLESALRSGLVGFQQLELDRRGPSSGSLVQIGRARKPSRPVYRPVAKVGDLPTGALKPVMLGDAPVLLANVDGEIYAVGNHCGESPLPLEFSELDGPVLRCSWHGCEYDVRSGRRVDGGPDRLSVLPVAVEGDEVRIAIGVQARAGTPGAGGG